MIIIVTIHIIIIVRIMLSQYVINKDIKSGRWKSTWIAKEENAMKVIPTGGDPEKVHT